MVSAPPNITPEQIAVLEKQDVETLCLWYCMINKWGWPAGLPDDPCHGCADHDKRMSMILSTGLNRVSLGVMDWIVDKVGQKAVSRCWNVIAHKHMTEEAFEEWWSSKDNKRSQ